MFHFFIKAFCNTAAGKERLRCVFSFSAGVLLCGALLVSLGVPGCGRAGLKEGVYSCVEGEEDTCPPGWICRRNSDGDYRCFSTDGHDDGGVDGGEDANLNDGGDVDGGCECGEGDGPCCDGCNFRSTDYKCDDTPVGIERACNEPACGTTIIEAISYRHCSGLSAECDSSNIRGAGEWEVAEYCEPNQACREAGEGDAYCQPCSLGCHQNECCVDNDSDGYYGNCPPYDCDDFNPDIHPAADEIPANCIDENCNGEDAVGDPDIISLEVSPNPASSFETVDVVATATEGFTDLSIGLQRNNEDIDYIYETATGNGNYFEWHWTEDKGNPIPIGGPGTYKVIFHKDDIEGVEPSGRVPLICRTLEVN